MRTLIADDDRVSSKILERNLKDWGYDIVLASNGEEAWQIIREGNVRLAIVDWMMPEINGVELCRRIRQENGHKYIYIILLTSRDRGTDILEGLTSGADDYMTKPVNFLELKARLQTGHRIIGLEDKLLESNKKLEEMASRDSLTSLWNRANIVAFLDSELERGKRDGRPTSALMVDVDNFKLINDTFGHLAGDVVLIELAKRLSRSVRIYDKVGRYGGDEILVVLPNCGRTEATEVGERLRKAVSIKRVQTPAGEMNISITLGCSVSDEAPEPTAKALIEASDAALYKGKSMGRNLVVADSPLDKDAHEKTAFGS
jgi:two-component system, cell cycle response regulator